MTIPLHVGSDVIRSYRRLAYTPWHALAELIDNSAQSYFNNKRLLDKTLKKENEPLTIRVVYDKDQGFLRISDNSIGMNFDELTDALKLGKPPKITTGRSQYGLGLKTAACWLGDEWKVVTKKLGDTEEHTVTVNVEAVADGKTDLPHTSVRKPKEAHYTIVEISGMHSRLHGRTLGKIKQHLKSMYRVDLRDGVLALYWQGDRLTWDLTYNFLKTADGKGIYREEFDFEIDGKKVVGWFGVLESGSRKIAGFAVLRRGRVLKAHPEEWRPEKIFGPGGRNDLINQRITGEIHFDEFNVSHTKDAILWQGDQENDVEKKLKELAVDYIEKARTHRKKADQRGPTEQEVQAAADELRAEMESEEFVDKVDIEDVPPPEVIDAANKPVLDAAVGADPRFNARVGAALCDIYLSYDLSPNDPYYASDVTEGRILVVVNCQHPHWKQLEGSEGVLNYLRHVVYDAVAEWQCRRKKASVQPNTIKMLKDALLRLKAEIEEGAEEEEDAEEES